MKNRITKSVALDVESIKTIEDLEIKNMSDFINELIAEAGGNSGQDWWKRKLVSAVEDMHFIAQKAGKEVTISVK